ncbi:MAG: serine/threonine-protein kinase [Terracidiphilus sp.]|jgi:serine/threonine protein kinase
MPDEGKQRIAELFEAARQEKPERRREALRLACGGDEELVAAVSTLIAEYERLEDSLQMSRPIEEFPSSETPAAPTLAPERLAAIQQRFTDLKRLGAGGMGVVFRARDCETNEIVAIKVLHPEVAADPDAVQRFQRETTFAHLITHRNVCRTHGLYRLGDTLVIAMEYVEGESLRSIFGRVHGVSVPQALRWFSEICEALREAHSQGVVHRDLKPDNIMIGPKGQVKVMDFGIAHALGETGPTEKIGTPAYMSPEQVKGKAIDTRSDIYSLGILLYELLTGQPVFQADTITALSYMHVHEQPPRVSECNTYLPEYLDDVIEKCLKKDPRQRFQSVAELSTAVKRAELPSTPSQTVVPPHLSAPRRSDSALLALGATGLGLFVVLAYQIAPEANLRVRWTKAQFVDEARAELMRRGWQPPPHAEVHVDRDSNVDIGRDTSDRFNPYDYLTSRGAYVKATEHLLRDSAPYIFHIQFNTANGSANVLYEPGGVIRHVDVPIHGWVPEGTTISAAQGLQLGRADLLNTFGVNPDSLQLEVGVPYNFDDGGRHGYYAEWLKSDPTGIETKYAMYALDRVVVLSRWTTPPSGYTPPSTWYGRKFDSRIAGLVILILALLLLVPGGGHAIMLQAREVRIVAVAGLIWGMATPLSMLVEKNSGPPSKDALISFGVMWALGFVVLSYSVVSLAGRRWPSLTTSYTSLLEGRAATRSVAVAVARGAACGALLLGLYSSLTALAIRWHLGWPLLDDYFRDMNATIPSITLLGEALGNAAITTYALGLVLLLLYRWIKSRPLLALLGTGLWVASMNRLTLAPLPAGNLFQLGLTFVLVLGLCFVMLSFDVLTLLTAVFTFQLWFHGYPLTQMYSLVGSGQLWLVIVLWGGLVIWALTTTFRWHRVTRHVADVLGK